MSRSMPLLSSYWQCGQYEGSLPWRNCVCTSLVCRGIVFPANASQALTEVVTRAVNHTEEAGSKEVRVESVLAALEGVAKELGRPSLEARVRADIQELLQKQEQQERQQLEQQQQPAAPQQQQQQQGEGKGEEQDGRQPEKKARRSL